MSKIVSKGGPIAVLLILVTTAAFLAGCSSKSVKDDGAATTAVAVTASPSSVGLNATTVVEATIMNGTTPVTGQEVTFSVSPTGAGYFTPTSATTDADGVAATMFTASTTGSVSITAAAVIGDEPMSASTGVTVTSEQQQGSGNVTITVTPGLLLANGSDTSIVTVTARNSAGEPVPDGTPILLVAGEKFVDIDVNGTWTVGIDSLVFDVNGNGTWDAIGQIPSSVQVAGGAGQAQTTFVAGNSAGTVYIKATVGDESIGGSADKSLQLSPNAQVNSIFLRSDSVNLVVRGTGGIETSILEATAYDLWGNPVPEGLPISFVITDRPDTLVRLDTVGAGPYNTVTNSQGTARVPIQSGLKSGTVRIRAYCDTVMSNAAQIMVSAGPPAHIVVGADTCNAPFWNVVGEEVGVLAVVSDIYNNPVPNNTAVYFTTDEGSMKSHEARTQDLEGKAYTKWISGTQDGIGADGIVLVIAETAGGTVADTSFFFNTHSAQTIMVDPSAWPSFMEADGGTEYTVDVGALDLNGNYVVDGTPFEAQAKYVDVESGTFGDGCNMAIDAITLTAPLLTRDYSLTGGQDDGIGAFDTVRFSSGPARLGYAITLTTGEAYRANCEVSDGPKTMAQGEVGRFSVVIKDYYGNPLGDHTIVLSAPTGVVSGASQETNAHGEAGGFSWTAPAVAGDVNLTFQDTDPRGGVTITYKVTVE